MSFRAKRAIFAVLVFLFGFAYGAVFDDTSRQFKEIYCTKVPK